MNIFLTGVSGFSGSHLARYLVEKGHNVIGITRSSIGSIPKALTLLRGDLNTLQSLPNDIDVVIHTAASSPTPTTRLSNFIQDNILGTQKLITLAKAARVKQFIFFSSLSVYGEIKESIVNEQTPILNPGAYGASKLFGEFCLQECAEEMPSIAFRLPAVFGKGASRHWLANIILQAKKGEAIKIFNPTAPFNNAVHIHDLCNFIDVLLTKSFTGFTPLTLGSDGYLTIKSLVEETILAIRSSSEIIIDSTPRHSFTISSETAKKYYQYNLLPFKEVLHRYLMEI